MSLNERVFIIVPLIASICNIFLLLTVASVKKDRMVRSFMELLMTFTIWSLGSLFMRMDLFPGPSFWYMVSITGIFLVPFFLYNFIYFYTNTRGYFLRGVLLVSWIIIAVMNLSNVFITNPQIVYAGGERRFEYGVSPLLALPVVLAVFTILLACYLIYRSCKEGNISISQFFPLFSSCSLEPLPPPSHRWSPCLWTPSPVPSTQYAFTICSVSDGLSIWRVLSATNRYMRSPFCAPC